MIVCALFVTGFFDMIKQANVPKIPSLWPLYVEPLSNWDHKVDELNQVGTAIFGSFVIESQ